MTLEEISELARALSVTDEQIFQVRDWVQANRGCAFNPSSPAVEFARKHSAAINALLTGK